MKQVHSSTLITDPLIFQRQQKIFLWNSFRKILQFNSHVKNEFWFNELAINIAESPLDFAIILVSSNKGFYMVIVESSC